MNDDIVTRLRNRRGTIVRLCDDAADEIESLREDRRRWRTVAKELAAGLGKVEYAETAYTDLVDNESTN